ncbi:MAG: IS607 family transposase [Actinobacteria bacterium]|nr:IS607 family transposase [Actinomycetota bacterium]MCG2818786.1 IS607 family transposase [Actinomycetes bacterium]MBU4217721.1 IS607 family transposase [Actinomycetota bacterium]MBU4358966.1 IS607 family transposase [Actinomycetota bacterium]MBU4391693.1 IS607 family transposase [Actinomycetota bacterium]
MKLSAWAIKNGISYRTALRWYHDGTLPVRAEQLATGTILVYEDTTVHSKDNSVTIYARVSSHDQKEDMGRQVSRLKDYAAASGLRVKVVIEEIGSGLNGHRRKLLELLGDPAVGTILVEHKDRLTRFGFEFLEAAMMSQGRRIMVADDTEEMADIWADFIDVVTSMCERIYGKRGARNRANKAMAAVSDPEDQ